MSSSYRFQEVRVRPVSYTHLDVYKRQAYKCKYVYNCLTYYFLHFLATTLSFPGFTFETG